MPDSNEKRLLKKDKWPSGRVEEYHLYQCPRCKGWHTFKPDGPVRSPKYCQRCWIPMAFRGLRQLER